MLSKNKRSADLYFEFFNPNTDEQSTEKLKQIIIKDSSIDIDLEKKNYYQMLFNDCSESEYKVYAISFIFEKKNKVNFSISIYFDKKNYFYCVGKQINHNSIEIIFSDFSQKHQYLEDCFIFYDRIKFNVKEAFGDIKTRKRISFINIDADKLIIPKIKSNSDTQLEKPSLMANSLISISKGKIDTIIGIYKNEPFIPNKVDKKEIKKNLKNL